MPLARNESSVVTPPFPPAAGSGAADGRALEGEVLPPAAAKRGWQHTAEERVKLAARIAAAHDELGATVRTTVEKAVILGRLLLEAKALIGHGGFLYWVETCTSVKPRTATTYMQLARAADGPLRGREWQRLADLGIERATTELRRRQRQAKAPAPPAPPAPHVATVQPPDGPGGARSPAPGGVPPAAGVASRATRPRMAGADLWREIISLRKESDKGALERLKELESLDGRSGHRLLELLDAHIDAQARFLAGLRSLRERVAAEGAAA
jgi:hypothetical protein